MFSGSIGGVSGNDNDFGMKEIDPLSKPISPRSRLERTLGPGIRNAFREPSRGRKPD